MPEFNIGITIFRKGCQMSLRALLILSAATLLPCAAVPQTVIYGNLNATIGSYYNVQGQGPLYNSFSTGSASVVFTDLKVYLDLGDSPFGGVVVALFADSNAAPGNLIQTLGVLNDSVVANPGVYDFPVVPGITLNPNTRYWIGMSAPDGTEVQWASTDSTAGTGNIGSEYYCFSTFFQGVNNAPGRTQAHGRALTQECFSNTQAQDPFLMEVSTSAVTVPAPVPELSFTGMTLLSLLLAACAAVFLRRTASNQS